MKSIRVLITGAGSGVGQGIIKALRISSLPLQIVSCDIAPLNAALFRTDEAFLIPKVESEKALDIIIEKIIKADIDVVMIGSEFDLHFFAEHKAAIEAETHALIITSPLETVELAEDKWLTAEFLRKNNFPYAAVYIPSNMDDAIQLSDKWGYPLILKTRRGTSSRNFHIVKNRKQLAYIFDTVPNPMLQQMINMPSNALSREYTCSIFKCADETLVGPFTARRTLRGGSSWIIEVNQFKVLHSLLLSIGKSLPVMGSLNIQLMVGTDGPTPFEFNARFSGTTAIRAHFGFNEPEMVIRNYLLGETLENPVIRSGVVLRYLEEIFLENAAADEADQYFTKGRMHSWF